MKFMAAVLVFATGMFCVFGSGLLVGYELRKEHEATQPVQGPPGADGKPGRDGTDCDLNELRHEAQGYVNDIDARLDKLEADVQPANDADYELGRRVIVLEHRYKWHGDWLNQIESRLAKLENPCKPGVIIRGR